VKTVSEKDVLGQLLAYPYKNDWWGSTLSIWNCGSNSPRWSEIADFLSIFARSASAV